MSGPPYRQSRDDVRRRVVELEREIARLHRRITDSYWSYLAPTLGAQRQALSTPTSDDASWRQREEMLSSYKDELEFAVARAPAVAKELCTAPASIDPTALGPTVAELMSKARLNADMFGADAEGPGMPSKTI